jgi:hypothetical protein
MSTAGDRYWAAHEKALRDKGLDPDDDDAWATPDNDTPEEPVHEFFCDRPYYRGEE